LNLLGLSAFGEVQASVAGIKSLCGQTGQAPGDLCRSAVTYAAHKIRDAVEHLLWTINEKPVYTITELLEGKTIKPKRVYVMGGPAQALAGELEKVLGLPVAVPRHFAVANAIGAALTRTTMDIELFADTQKGRMFVPALGHEADIPKNYSLDDAERDAVELLNRRMRELGVSDGPTPEITGRGSFNMVEGFRTVGRNIRVKCQVRPGVIRTLAG
jgi:hypothetical protein